MKIGFIGLGTMGSRMAGVLAVGGHEITVYNRSRQKADAWAQAYAGTVVQTAK